MSFRRPAGNKDIDSTERRNQMNALNENSTSLDPFFKKQFITRSRLEVQPELIAKSTTLKTKRKQSTATKLAQERVVIIEYKKEEEKEWNLKQKRVIAKERKKNSRKNHKLTMMYVN
jgi:hypothetical protein